LRETGIEEVGSKIVEGELDGNEKEKNEYSLEGGALMRLDGGLPLGGRKPAEKGRKKAVTANSNPTCN